jgi:hypothetical protein
MPAHTWSLRLTRLLLAKFILMLAACTSVTVTPLDPALGVDHVCILRNKKVIVDDFLAVLRVGLGRNGISSTVYSGERPADCDYLLSYSALRSWDFAPYLSQAEIWITKDGRQVAHAEYHLVWKGGFSLMKWQGTETKMAPVIDEMVGRKMP